MTVDPTWDPRTAATLPALLRGRARNTPDGRAYDFEGRARTHAELWRDAEAFAAALTARGVAAGDRVLLVLPNGHDFFTAFHGAMRAGAVAVPTFPSVPPTRVPEMADLCGASVVVVPSDAPTDQRDVLRQLTGDVPVVSVADPPSGTGPLPAFDALDPASTAFLQYTSGSTGHPKGVVLTHEGLLTNVRQMIAGMALTPDDRFVSWLPCYHDMGLILMTLAPLYLGARLFLLPTSLRDTRPWLDAIEHHRGTFTASPDFGYRLALRAPGPRPDLSTLRVALNAAEPVRPDTIASFHDTFGLQRVMVAGYGLAEATVGVAMWPPGTPNRVDDDGQVSVGPPFPGIRLRIVDDNGADVPNGTSGHLIVDSPANTPSYFGNDAATAALHHPDGGVRTGDIARLDADGNLTILGRAKDVIITGGRSVHPEEVEEIAERVTGVRYAAAIGVDRGRVEGEQLVVVAEIRPDDLPDDVARKRCAIAVTNGINDRFGLRPARVLLVQPRTIPLTHNGKRQRHGLRALHTNGALKDRTLFPPPVVVP